MADPYAPRHIIYANVVAGTSSQPQMTEQIRSLSKEVIGLRGQIPTHSQPPHDVPTHILPPQPQRTPIAQRRLSYVEEYEQKEEEPQRCHSSNPT